MATAKKTSVPAAKKTRTTTPAAKTAAAAPRPIKQTFTKAALTAHLAEQSAVEPKAVKAVLAALESAVLGSVHKKGAGEFRRWGWSDRRAAGGGDKEALWQGSVHGRGALVSCQAATVKVKARALKKLKDAVA